MIQCVCTLWFGWGIWCHDTLVNAWKHFPALKLNFPSPPVSVFMSVSYPTLSSTWSMTRLWWHQNLPTHGPVMIPPSGIWRPGTKAHSSCFTLSEWSVTYFILCLWMNHCFQFTSYHDYRPASTWNHLQRKTVDVAVGFVCYRVCNGLWAVVASHKTFCWKNLLQKNTLKWFHCAKMGSRLLGWLCRLQQY